MSNADAPLALQGPPHWRDVLELFKPVTWFAPMWAFACGAVSAGVPLQDRWAYILGGIVLAGPLVCAARQAVNDWFDRHVDAINEPDRPIPSGRIPGRWGLYLGVAWSAASIGLGAILGLWAFAAALVAVGLAWAYSAPPLRLKADGWTGPAAVGLCYEGVAWFTGAAVVAGAQPGTLKVAAALLNNFGAHGIMTLNDFKAVEGDRRMGIRSLPAQLGTDNAARIACAVMTAPQLAVIAGLFAIGAPRHALIVAGLLIAQFYLMAILLRAPEEKAPWYNATGTSLYVLGMLATAFALGSLGGGPPWP